MPFVTINEEQRVNLELTVRRPIVHRELRVDVQRAEEVREVEDDFGRVARRRASNVRLHPCIIFDSALSVARVVHGAEATFRRGSCQNGGNG